MRKFNLIYKLKLWETIFLVSSILGLLLIMLLDSISTDFYKYYPLTLSSLIGLTSCIITAIGIVYIQKIDRNRKLFNHYIKIEGPYIRVDMGQDNTLPEKLDYLEKENIGLAITLTYVGENRFTADIEYWKSDSGRVTGIIEFNESNKLLASGTYKYYQGGNRFKDHFGKFDIFRFEDNANLIYVKYQHVFPRKSPQSPDENRGWEVWQKLSSFLH